MKRFGLLSYNNTGNIGDEIQSLAAQRFIPSTDLFIDREELHSVDGRVDHEVHVIANGWFCHYPERWPPSPKVRPLLISMHISPLPSVPGSSNIPSKIFTSPIVAEYLRRHGPVGARDQQTLEILQSAGIASYFSACMTLTIQRPDVERCGDLIVVNEVPTSILRHIRTNTKKRIFRTNHVNFGSSDRDERFARAQELLDMYARASCVVTTRLHCALPCIAMGTPVLLIDTAPDQHRFSGLHDFIHHCTVDQLLKGAFHYSFDDLMENKRLHLPYREALIRRATEFVDAR